MWLLVKPRKILFHETLFRSGRLALAVLKKTLNGATVAARSVPALGVRRDEVAKVGVASYISLVHEVQRLDASRELRSPLQNRTGFHRVVFHDVHHDSLRFIVEVVPCCDDVVVFRDGRHDGPPSDAARGTGVNWLSFVHGVAPLLFEGLQDETHPAVFTKPLKVLDTVFAVACETFVDAERGAVVAFAQDVEERERVFSAARRDENALARSYHRPLVDGAKHALAKPREEVLFAQAALADSERGT